MIVLEKFGGPGATVIKINWKPGDHVIWVDRLKSGMIRVQYKKGDDILSQILPKPLKKVKDERGTYVVYIHATEMDLLELLRRLRERRVLVASVVSPGRTYLIR